MVDVAAAPGFGQHGPQPRTGQRRRERGCGGRGEHGAGVAACQAALGLSGERVKRGRIKLLEQRAELVAQLLTGPDRVLLCSRQHPHRLGQLGVDRQRPVRVGVGAHDVGQHHRVRGVGLRARNLVPGPVTRRRERVDCIDGAAGGAQRGNKQSVVGFDAHRDRVHGGVPGLGEQVQQTREPGRVVTDPGLHDHGSGVVDDGDIVVGFGPVDAAKQCQDALSPSVFLLLTGPGRVTQRPNRGTQRSVISVAVRDSSTPQEPRSAEELEAREHIERSPPAADSSNDIPPPQSPIHRQTRRSFRSRRTTGNTRRRPPADQHPTSPLTAPFFLKTSYVWKYRASANGWKTYPHYRLGKQWSVKSACGDTDHEPCSPLR